MPTKYLRLCDDLEAIRADVEQRAGRPTFLAACDHSGDSDCRFRRPEDTAYESWGNLRMFLSPWAWLRCSGLFDEAGNLFQGDKPPREPGWFRGFDLQAASWLHLVYPMMPGENNHRAWKDPHFSAHNIPADWNQWGKVVVLNNDIVPENLGPFVAMYPNEYPEGHVRHRTRLGIRFAVSEYIERPAVARPGWHEGISYNLHHRQGVAASLQPPGWYSGADITSLREINTWCMVNRDPGGCIHCQGASGHRKHVAANRGKEYPVGMVCLACFPMFAEQVQALLAAWVPPALPPDEEQQ